MTWNDRVIRLSIVTTILAAILGATVALAKEPGNDAFERIWSRHDLPVQTGATDRTWLWGPEAFTTPVVEFYDQPRLRNQPERTTRIVQYFDKARMEITDPNADPESLWYVTNGLLVVEMMTGQLQIADDQFDSRDPASINVAGDGDNPNGPTYAALAPLTSAPPAADGASLIQRLTPDGEVVDDEGLAGYGVTAAYHVDVSGIDHQVASPFWELMTGADVVWQDGDYAIDDLFDDPFYATGLPLTEAYWATVPVGGVEREALLQCFERRCLTYTPDNPEGWQIEAGNVGRHYYEWRYGHGPSEYQFSGAISAPEEYMSAFTISNDGLIYTVLPHPSLIRVHSPDGTLLDQWMLGDGEFHIIDHDIEIGPDGNIHVLDGATAQIWVYTPEGEPLEPIPLNNETTRNVLGRAAAIAFGDEGVIYVLNQPVFRQDIPGTIDVINREGEILDAWEGIDAIHYGRDMAVANDRIYVATDDSLVFLSPDGQVIGEFPDIRGRRIAADVNGYLYLADNHPDDSPAALARITVVDQDGGFVTAWVPASLEGQTDVGIRTVRAIDGAVYIHDFRSDALQVFTPRG